ncbi:MAG: hypothetical protein ACRD3W_14055, partial [Terriglobales bacterium]
MTPTDKSSLPAQPIYASAATGRWQHVLNWLYLPHGYSGIIRRLTALWTLPILLIVWNGAHGGPGPYIIPAWRFNDHLFYLPQPPELITTTIFSIAALFCLAMIFGVKRRVFLWPVVAVMAYYGCTDLWACWCGFVIMDFTMLVALLFDRPGMSLCRRLIQISIFLCYFYSALHKLLLPDFLNGSSFYSFFHDGFAVVPLWVPLLKSISVPIYTWQIWAWLTVVFEFALPFGLFSARFRKVSLIAGTLFHLAILIVIADFISIYSFVMVTGYLAFLEKGGEQSGT